MTSLQPTQDEHLLEALSDGKIIMGLWPVLFGWRVRAGKVGEMYYNIDWCCGDNEQVIWTTYEMTKLLLENKDISTLRGHSNIKPWINDKEFADWLLDEVKPLKRVFIITERPPLQKLRLDYMDKLDKIKETDHP